MLEIRPSNVSNGTISNKKFTGVRYEIANYWDSNSYSKKVIIKNDLLQSEDAITDDLYEKNRKTIINNFNNAIQPYRTKLAKISNEVTSLKDIN